MPDLGGSLAEIEARLTGRALAWIGGLALVLGAIFFLSLAFTRGWIGPELRVAIGLVAGAVAMAGGGVFMARGNRLLGHVLTPVGLAIISISLAAATNLYGLVTVEVGLAGALVSAIAAAVIAIRSDSQVVALFGLVAVLVAPPLLRADPNVVTLMFVTVVLIGTTTVALWRAWTWLPPFAFLLSAPQAAAWVANEPDVLIGLFGIALYWVLNTVAAGGEAFRRRRDDLTTSSASLLLANAAFLVWAGFVVLSGEATVFRGPFLVAVAIAHIGIGGFFVVRDGERNLFGLLTLATGIAALTMAAPVQLGASVVPIAWTAEAAALAWLAARRGHPYSAAVSVILFAMAGAAVIWLFQDRQPSPGVPFLDPAGASLGFFVGGLLLGIWLVRDRSLRSGLAAFGLLVVAYCLPTTLYPPAAVVGFTGLMVAGTALWRVLPVLPSAPIAWQVEGLIPAVGRSLATWRQDVDRLLAIAILLVGVSATAWLVSPVLGAEPGTADDGIPFVNAAGAALAIYLVGLAAIAWTSGVSRLREPLAAVGVLVSAWACAVELDGVALVAGWSGLMVVAFALWRGCRMIPHDPPFRLPSGWTSDWVLPAAGSLAGLLALGHVLRFELPLDQFGDVIPPTIPFTDTGAIAALLLVVAILASAWLVGGAIARRAALLGSGVVVAYTIPYEVYAWAVPPLWVGLAITGLAIGRSESSARTAFRVAAGALIAASGVVAIGMVAPPTRLVIDQAAVPPLVAVQSAAALLAVATGLALLARDAQGRPWGRYVRLGAGVVVVYLLSVAVVDAFASRVGGDLGTDELRTQGQVALSVLWAVLGVASFVSGLGLRADDLRHGGLALLGLATAKVFLFDLAALDVAYRVVSLIVLGLLLLASAWMWQRLQPRAPAPIGPPDPGGGPPPT